MKHNTVHVDNLYPALPHPRRTSITVLKPNTHVNERRDYGLPEPKFIHLRQRNHDGTVENDGGITVAYHYDKDGNEIRYAFSRCPGGINYNKYKGRMTSGGRFVSKKQSSKIYFYEGLDGYTSHFDYLIEIVKEKVHLLNTTKGRM